MGFGTFARALLRPSWATLVAAQLIAGCDTAAFAPEESKTEPRAPGTHREVTSTSELVARDGVDSRSSGSASKEIVKTIAPGQELRIADLIPGLAIRASKSGSPSTAYVKDDSNVVVGKEEGTAIVTVVLEDGTEQRITIKVDRALDGGNDGGAADASVGGGNDRSATDASISGDDDGATADPGSSVSGSDAGGGTAADSGSNAAPQTSTELGSGSEAAAGSGAGTASDASTPAEDGSDAAAAPTDTASGEVDPDSVVEGEVIATDDPAKCWFAVSGAYFGYRGSGSSCGAKFPGTVSGKPIAGAERFDDCGGIFLNASDVPYRYNAGGHELDKAIDMSFDSIAVSPGMHAVIKSDQGTLIYEGDGPYLAISTEWGNSVPDFGKIFRPKAAQMPAWMKAYLEKTNYVLSRLPLWKAYEVKVTKLEGQRCE